MGNVTQLPPRPGNAWMADLARDPARGFVLGTVDNILLILTHDAQIADLFAYDEFAFTVVVMECPPIRDGASRPAGPYPRIVNETDLTLVQSYLQRSYGMNASAATTAQACLAHGEMKRFHPVRDWLNSLVWDKIERVGTWLTDAFGAPEDPYHHAVATKFLVAAVRRVRQPGVKFDNLLIFEGLQGKGKSLACETLFSPQWFKDDLSHDLASKDAQQGMSGRWGIELAEVQALVKSTAQASKAFFSRRVDHFRPPYGKSFVERPRQCVFVGTTNEDDYLSDTTGNRRYWPVRCEFVDIGWIRANREQLWAEACELEASGMTLWLDDDVSRQDAEQLQEARVATDPWEEKIVEFLATMTVTTTSRIIHECLALPMDRRNRSVEMRVGAILRQVGWTRHVAKVGTRSIREWRRENDTY